MSASVVGEIGSGANFGGDGSTGDLDGDGEQGATGNSLVGL